MDDHFYALGEIDRRLNNMVRYGEVAEVDATAARAKVDLGEMVTDWLPWATARAGNNRHWAAPEVGDQVVLLAPGDPSLGVIIGCLYQSSHPANGSSLTVERKTYQDGTVVEYDRAAHRLMIDASGSTSSVLVKCTTATVEAATSVTVDTPLTHCTGQLTVDGLLTYGNGISGTGGANGNTITGSVNVQNGTVAVTNGDVTADSISLKNHIHQIAGGGGHTDVPE